MKIPSDMSVPDYLALRDFLAAAIDVHGSPGGAEYQGAERLIQFGLVDIPQAQEQMLRPGWRLP